MDSAPPTDPALLLAEADAAAARVCRTLGLPAVEQEDLRQELLADLIRRLPRFDPARGTLGAFVGTILRHQASRIALRTLRERRMTGGRLLSLDATASDGSSLHDRLSEEDGLATWHGRPPGALERRRELVAGLGWLDTLDRVLCFAVAQRSVDELAGGGLGSRAGLYRRIRDIRLQLACHGLQAA